MSNKWQDIWNNKQPSFSEIDLTNYKQVLLEMKRLSGWDHFGKGASVQYEAFEKESQYIKENLCLQRGDTVFEVGCNAGANLYLLARKGIKIGGMDYACQLVESAKRLLPKDMLIECSAGEAIDLTTEIKYDAVFAGGVFKYFPSLEYATTVLDKMLKKTKR